MAYEKLPDEVTGVRSPLLVTDARSPPARSISAWPVSTATRSFTNW